MKSGDVDSILVAGCFYVAMAFFLLKLYFNLRSPYEILYHTARRAPDRRFICGCDVVLFVGIDLFLGLGTFLFSHTRYTEWLPASPTTIERFTWLAPLATYVHFFAAMMLAPYVFPRTFGVRPRNERRRWGRDRRRSGQRD